MPPHDGKMVIDSGVAATSKGTLDGSFSPYLGKAQNENDEIVASLSSVGR